MTVGVSPYRLRDVLLLGVGLTFFGAHLGVRLTVLDGVVGYPVSAWLPYVAAAVAATVVGTIAGEGNDGGGAAAFAVGIGGGLFVGSNFLVRGTALLDVLRFAVLSFAVFGAVGIIVGGVTGLARGYALRRASSDDG